MRTTVVTGLLGAGKTSFIRSFLKDRTEKTVVLVNDFGLAGIDGETLSAVGIEAIELPSGCVCCTLKFDLITTIQKVMQEFAPVHLLIEPSGVASPAGVLEALASAGLAPPSVVGVVDAVEFAELYSSGVYGNFFREQIERSDAILVNKTDIASEEAVFAAERLIEEINPQAVRLRTVNAAWREARHLLPVRGREGARKRSHAQGSDRPFRSNTHCRFETLSYKLSEIVSRQEMRELFGRLAQGRYGNVARAKALVETEEGPYRFDLTFGKVDAVRFDRSVTDTRLVIIGAQLDGAALEQDLTALGHPG